MGDPLERSLVNLVGLYRPYVNRLRLVGPGSTSVAFIEGGGVSGMTLNVRDIDPEPVAEQPVVGAAQAVHGLVEDLKARAGDEIGADDVELVHAELGYYAGAKRFLQRYLEPTYLFAYRLRSEFATSGFVYVHPAAEARFEYPWRRPAEAQSRAIRAPLARASSS
jgi:hypothetical protein